MIGLRANRKIISLASKYHLVSLGSFKITVGQFLKLEIQKKREW